MPEKVQHLAILQGLPPMLPLPRGEGQGTARRRTMLRFRMAAAALIGLALAGCSSSAPAKDLPGGDSSVGHKLYVAKCAKCHKFYDPAKYSGADWEMWMTKMSKKAKLKPEQEAELSRYITENLRMPGGTNSVSHVK
jgi:mono/diheme cytochrome c family protein